MSELDRIAPGGVVQLTQPPAGLDDQTFDSLFPAESASVTVAPAQQVTAQPGQQTQQTQQTQSTPTTQQTQNDYFLKGNSSVYKTPEEATKGINEKDALIEQLRQRYALTTGIDPVTGQPVGQAAPQQQQDYFQNPAKYLDDLYSAAKAGGPEAYRDVQAKFMMDTLKPLQPILQKAARDQAAVEVSNDPAGPIKGINEFLTSPGYQKALDSNPELKQAISVGETDYRFHSRLPGLYKLAYLTAQGMQLPELLKAQAAQSHTTTQPTQPVRTTVQPTTTSRSTTQGTNPSFKTLEGIKAIIADSEARGINLNW
jgi:hypothetical protein